MENSSITRSVYNTVLNSFTLPRGTKQQLAAHKIVSRIVYLYYLQGGITIILQLIGVKAGYSRFSNYSVSNKFKIPAKLAWFLFEAPSFCIGLYFFIQAHYESFGIVPIGNRLLLSCFLLHYLNRIRGSKPTGIEIVLGGALFTGINGLLQGVCLTKIDDYNINEMYSLKYLFGLTMFIFGFAINVHSDSILRNLRKPNETGYKIPYGGLFEFVTAANYFGEFLEWLGFAIAANNIGGYIFAINSFLYLFPRAVQSHKWYKQKFENYPKNRKIFFPFVL